MLKLLGIIANCIKSYGIAIALIIKGLRTILKKWSNHQFIQLDGSTNSKTIFMESLLTDDSCFDFGSTYHVRKMSSKQVRYILGS